jgi:hypothetical protein
MRYISQIFACILLLLLLLLRCLENLKSQPLHQIIPAIADNDTDVYNYRYIMLSTPLFLRTFRVFVMYSVLGSENPSVSVPLLNLISFEDLSACWHNPMLTRYQPVRAQVAILTLVTRDRFIQVQIVNQLSNRCSCCDNISGFVFKPLYLFYVGTKDITSAAQNPMVISSIEEIQNIGFNKLI